MPPRTSACRAPPALGLLRHRDPRASAAGAASAIVDDDGSPSTDAEILTRIARARRSRRPGRTCGSARIPAATSRPPASTPRGRKQYLYHPRWRERRDQREVRRHARLRPHAPPGCASASTPTSSAETCPSTTSGHRRRGCSTAASSAIGCEDYAVTNETYGLATMKKRHVRLQDERIALRLPGQARQAPRAGRDRPGGGRRRRAPQAPPRRRGGAARLQARAQLGQDIKSADINAWLKDATGEDISAKDFRTWGATVLAAVALAVSGGAAGHQDGAQARRDPRGQGGRPLPGQHARRGAGLLHRPAGA